MASLSIDGVERTFDPAKIIVSKTDLKGKITYVNRLFCQIADYEEGDVMGKPHNIIRHDAMPRGVFELLWSRLKTGKEIFAYVVNSTKGGDHYWVLAHVTPSHDADGSIVGYHSNRRVPRQSALEVIKPLYADMLQIEGQSERRKDGIEASCRYLEGWLKDKGASYDEFIFSV